MFMFSCRFETKIGQNAPNPISISIFRGNPQTPGRGGRGGKGQEEGGEGRERGRRGKGREGEVCVIAVGDRRPWFDEHPPKTFEAILYSGTKRITKT